jgi:O-antigen/teichoic acid export membrane protein
MVALLLGSQWMDSAPIVVWLALGISVWGLCHGIITVLNVTGRARLTAQLTWLVVALLAPSVLLGGVLWGLEGIAAMRLAVTVVMTPILFLALQKAVRVSAGEILARIWRPVAAAALMAIAIKLAHPYLTLDVPLRLLCEVLLGIVTFSGGLMMLWLISGKAPGIERATAERLVQAGRRLAHRAVP